MINICRKALSIKLYGDTSPTLAIIPVDFIPPSVGFNSSTIQHVPQVVPVENCCPYDWQTRFSDYLARYHVASPHVTIPVQSAYYSAPLKTTLVLLASPSLCWRYIQGCRSQSANCRFRHDDRLCTLNISYPPSVILPFWCLIEG